MVPNIALIVLDTLRYDAFERAFDWLPGTRFSQAYSTSHWTIPAHASLFTGYYASEIGVHSKSPTLDCSQETLAETLRDTGYHTRCLSANPNIVYWDGWKRGFDEVIAPARLDPRDEDLIDWDAFTRDTDPRGFRKLPLAIRHCIHADCPTLPALWQGYRHFMRSPANGGTGAITKRIRTIDFGENEFLFVNLMETHTPYHSSTGTPITVDTGDAFAGTVENTNDIKAAYATSVEYLADTYRDLYPLLEREFDYIITVGDHGELLGEDEMWNHGYGLYPELTHIPLVIDGPGLETDTYTDPVSLLDVHRTITMLGEAETESRGQDLLTDPVSRDRLTEYHGFLPYHREQFERKGVRAGLYEERDTQLYGILTSDGEYAYETHTDGLRSIGDIKKDELRRRLESLTDSLDQRSTNEGKMEIDDALREQLEDLGYA